jgi:hypothetical protein
VNALALVLNENLRKHGCLEWRWLGVFVALNHQMVVGAGCCRWAHRTVLSHPVLEGKPNVKHVRARIRTHVHSDYIIGHHHTMLELNSRKVLSYIKTSETSIESIT